MIQLKYKNNGELYYEFEYYTNNTDATKALAFYNTHHMINSFSDLTISKILTMREKQEIITTKGTYEDGSKYSVFVNDKNRIKDRQKYFKETETKTNKRSKPETIINIGLTPPMKKIMVEEESYIDARENIIEVINLTKARKNMKKRRKLNNLPLPFKNENARNFLKDTIYDDEPPNNQEKITLNWGSYLYTMVGEHPTFSDLWAHYSKSLDGGIMCHEDLCVIHWFLGFRS